MSTGTPGPVLVPLDGSEVAERALPLASGLARRAGATLQLLHVHVPLPADPIYVEGLPLLDEHLHPRRREHERAYLEQVRARVAADVPTSVTLLDGSAAGAIARHAATSRAWLVVLTTHGRGGVERAWLGSVTDELARVSPVPLLVVRPEPPAAPAIARVLVPLDTSQTSEAILEHAVRIARIEGAELVLLAIVRPLAAAVWLPEGPIGATPVPEPEDVLRRQETAARAYLERTAATLAAAGIRARTRLEVAPSVAPAVLAAAAAEGAGLIAMATHGRSGLARLALGSVADKVVRGGQVPVLLFRPSTS
jgi:nucleotide-binding universal stress UspA family protein